MQMTPVSVGGWVRLLVSLVKRLTFSSCGRARATAGRKMAAKVDDFY